MDLMMRLTRRLMLKFLPAAAVGMGTVVPKFPPPSVAGMSPFGDTGLTPMGVKPPAPPSDELAAAAVEVGAAIDEMIRLDPIYDALAEAEDRDATHRFEDETWDPAEKRLHASELELVRLMRVRGDVAIVVRGKLYIDQAEAIGMNVYGDAWPQHILTVAVDDLTPIG
jgi:hypothetical protein